MKRTRSAVDHLFLPTDSDHRAPSKVGTCGTYYCHVMFQNSVQKQKLELRVGDATRQVLYQYTHKSVL